MHAQNPLEHRVILFDSGFMFLPRYLLIGKSVFSALGKSDVRKQYKPSAFRSKGSLWH